MNYERHVTSLELSRKLKDLEVLQKSIFYWQLGMQYPYIVRANPGSDSCSAFLASELGEMLPKMIHKPLFSDSSAPAYNSLENDAGGWMIRYGNAKDGDLSAPYPTEMERTLPNMMGNTLAYLIERGIIDPKKLGATG